MILSPLYRMLNEWNLNKRGKNLHQDYLWKPIIACSRCMAGFYTMLYYVYLVFFTGIDYNFFLHIFLICFAVYIAHLLQKTL